MYIPSRNFNHALRFLTVAVEHVEARGAGPKVRNTVSEHGEDDDKQERNLEFWLACVQEQEMTS